ncbi:hypothetical protein ACFE04_020221 [Oxalis oulophora]
MRTLTSYGVFKEHLEENRSSGERRFSLTEMGKTLVNDNEGVSLAPYVLFQNDSDALVRTWPLLHEAVLDPRTVPFFNVNGEKADSYCCKRPETNEVKIKGMAGGSTGYCLRMILQKHPTIREAINFDLPEVVAKAPTILGVTHVGGDMFKSIPSCDALFLKWVLTAWADEECKVVMDNCYQALREGGKLIICEPILPMESDDDSHKTRSLLTCDLFIMLFRKGKQRTIQELDNLARSAGFLKCRVFPQFDDFYTLLEFKR